VWGERNPQRTKILEDCETLLATKSDDAPGFEEGISRVGSEFGLFIVIRPMGCVATATTIGG